MNPMSSLDPQILEECRKLYPTLEPAELLQAARNLSLYFAAIFGMQADQARLASQDIDSNEKLLTMRERSNKSKN